jgi:hypothetical protein
MKLGRPSRLDGRPVHHDVSSLQEIADRRCYFIFREFGPQTQNPN